MKLEKLYEIIKRRREVKPSESYVASLTDDRIIQKVGEEAVEVIIAAKNIDKERIISESTDLLFHLMILLEKSDIRLDELYQELDERNKNKAY
jgi:phosphoribosyl-ATP pyrophosphohydrolase